MEQAPPLSRPLSKSGVVRGSQDGSSWGEIWRNSVGLLSSTSSQAVFAEDEEEEFFVREEDENVFIGDPRNYLDRRKQPQEFWLLVTVAHLALLLSLRGYSAVGLVTRVILVWIGVRYAFVRLSMMGGTQVIDPPAFRPRILAGPSHARLRERGKEAGLWMAAIVSWKEPGVSAMYAGAFFGAALLLSQVPPLVGLYVLFMGLVLRINLSKQEEEQEK